MAIFDYDNTINTLNEYSIDQDEFNFINEAGLGIEHTSGFYELSTQLIALAKKVGGKITKKKNYTSKSIKYQIERNEKLRKKYVEELELLKNNNYKIKPSMVAKWFFGLYTCSMVSASIGIFIGTLIATPFAYNNIRNTDPVVKVADKVFGKSIGDGVARIGTKQIAKSAMISTTKIMAIINAILSAGITASTLADYEKSLKNGIKQIDENIKQLKSYYDKMVKIENSKNK